jgi:hypothetical protein
VKVATRIAAFVHRGSGIGEVCPRRCGDGFNLLRCCSTWRGFNAVAKIQNDALDAILAEQAASVERRNKSKEDGIPTIAAMACFELPDRPARGD